MKIFGYNISKDKEDIKKSLAIPNAEAMHGAAVNVNGSWISIADINNAKQFIKYGYDELDSVYAPITKIHSMMKSIKVRLKNSKGEYVDKHPILDLLKKPNSNQTWNDILGFYVGYKKVTGNFYMFAERLNDNSEPIGLYVFPSQYTKVLVSNMGSIYSPQLEGYELNFNSVDFKVPKSEVMHITETRLSIQNDADVFYGQSPLRPLARKLRTNNGVLTSAIALLENGGAQGMLSPAPQSFQSDETPEITEEFLTNLKSSFREQYQGEPNSGSVILTSLPMLWTAIGMKMVDMQLFDVDKLTYKSVCNVLGLKDVLFNNDASSTYNNVRQASQDAYLQVVIPEYNDLIEGLNNWLVPMFADLDDYELILDAENIAEIQSYRLEQAKAFMPFKSEMSTNEVRTKVLGLDPREVTEEGWESADDPIYSRDLMYNQFSNGFDQETSE